MTYVAHYIDYILIFIHFILDVTYSSYRLLYGRTNVYIFDLNLEKFWIKIFFSRFTYQLSILTNLKTFLNPYALFQSFSPCSLATQRLQNELQRRINNVITNSIFFKVL